MAVQEVGKVPAPDVIASGSAIDGVGSRRVTDDELAARLRVRREVGGRIDQDDFLDVGQITLVARDGDVHLVVAAVLVLDHQIAEVVDVVDVVARSEEHTSELQSLMRSSYAVFCLKKKKRD